MDLSRLWPQLWEYPTASCDSSGSFAELSACAICQHDIAAGEEIATLPCGHTFHCECVDDWLRISKACPTCRRRI